MRERGSCILHHGGPCIIPFVLLYPPPCYPASAFECASHPSLEVKFRYGELDVGRGCKAVLEHKQRQFCSSHGAQVLRGSGRGSVEGGDGRLARKRVDVGWRSDGPREDVLFSELHQGAGMLFLSSFPLPRMNSLGRFWFRDV